MLYKNGAIKMINICIVGASGLVGREMLNEIEAMDFGEKSITLFASAKSKGLEIKTDSNVYIVEELNKNVDFGRYNVALFSAGKCVSKEYAPLFAEKGCYVVDNSSCFRQDKDKPLLAMGVNLEDFYKYDSKIIANPNCSTIQSVVVLKQLKENYKIKDIDYVTYQSVSGSGIAGIEDLERTNNGLKPLNYEFPIANNVIPKIDYMLDDNYTFEEEKMIFETQKILNSDVDVSATCVRVPVKNSHLVEMRIEFEEDIKDVKEIINILKNQRHLEILEEDLPMPLMVKGERFVQVGRIRKHRTNNKVILLMCVADNLKVGAATNACEIVKYIVQEGLC